ncbi:MAG: KEOPS complex subunit Pcc1 [Candidatus Micrarchaeota archaeon]
MKSTFEIDFKDKKQAEDALKVIRPQKGRNTTLHVLHKKESNSITYVIDAESFSPLRARSTSLLRDLKIMFNVLEKAEEKPKR